MNPFPFLHLSQQHHGGVGNLGSSSQLDSRKEALQSLVGTSMILKYLGSKSINIFRALRRKISQVQCCDMHLLFFVSLVSLYWLNKCSGGRGKGLLELGGVSQGGPHEVRKAYHIAYSYTSCVVLLLITSPELLVLEHVYKGS